MSQLWIALFPFAVFFAWLVVSGILRTRSCPNCHAPLAAIQSPFTKTRRQWIEGGFTCPDCGCETDPWGRIVTAKTAVRRFPLALSAALLTLAVAPAFVLLSALLQR